MNNVESGENLPTRGSLFEHMSFFQTKDGKQFVGQGVQFYRKFMNVTKYVEVMNAINPLIQNKGFIHENKNIRCRLSLSVLYGKITILRR
jgi:hypothetical protein